ncbi:MAG: glycosyltransferase family 2 protein [Candidatus Hydrogenedentales bacterium]
MRQGILTLVIPLYNEGEHFQYSFYVIRDTLDRLPSTQINGWECVLVDDGSADNTWEVLQGLAKSDTERIVPLRFSRNFGKEAAIRAGLAQATGDLVIVMDGDLEHPPAMIPDMVNLWATGNIDVVNTVKEQRSKESPLYRFAVFLFNFLMRLVVPQHVTGDSDFKLLDRKVVDAFLVLAERRSFFRGLIGWMGFRSARLPLPPMNRTVGQTKFTMKSLIELGMTALTSFSTLALHFVTILGFLFTAISLLFGIYVLAMWWLGKAVEGFTTVIFLQLIIGSVIMLALGIIGEYLSIIYTEVKQRPHYILSESGQDQKRNLPHDQ